MSIVCLRRPGNVYLSYDGITYLHRGAKFERTKFPGQFNVGLFARSSSCRYISLEFRRSTGEPHFEEVMQGLLENASTIAAKEVSFKSALLTRSGLALTTRLVESLVGVRHVDYGTVYSCTFPDVSFEQAVKDLQDRQHPYQYQPSTCRVMDDEIIGFCKKKSPEDRHRSVTFSEVTVTKGLFREIVKMRLNGELPEEFELRIISPYANPEQELGDFETVPDHAGRFCDDYVVKGTDLKLRQDGDSERDNRDANIWNYSYMEEKCATDDE